VSRAIDAAGPAPEARERGFLRLLFGASAAPLAWLGQVMLAYAVTAYVCYPGDHPVGLSSGGPLFAVLIASDLAALAVCMSAGWVSWKRWERLTSSQGRNRFLALWGVMSSLWFLAAILFNVLASLMVPLCGS
jgi:hypothetical protein